MPLPEFNLQGDLPEGIHPATLEEVTARFGGTTSQRQEVTERLRRLHRLATETEQLMRLLVYGSYVTVKPSPNDVDIFLLMARRFSPALVTEEAQRMLDHQRADREFGASVFWMTLDSPPEWIALVVDGWQGKRGGGRRGIVEIIE